MGCGTRMESWRARVLMFVKAPKSKKWDDATAPMVAATCGVAAFSVRKNMKKILRGVVAAATACTVLLGGASAAFAEPADPAGATTPVGAEGPSGAGDAGATDPGAQNPAAADTSTAEYAAGKINEALGATPVEQADAWMVGAL